MSFVALILLGCGSGEPDAAAAGAAARSVESEGADGCDGKVMKSIRRDFLDRVGAPPLPGGLATPRMGSKTLGSGWTAQAVGWEHPTVRGDFVHGVFHLPDPLPESPLPLLVNTHGHWGAGLESDEVARRSQLFAARGWAVLSVANRGSEGGETGPMHRAVHLKEGIYGEMRVRRTGTTPLAWDLRASQAGLAMALAGRLGAAVDPDAVAVMGFSGGADRAVLLAVADPRIGAVVLGAHEYIFSSQHGKANCSCGALRGAGESAVKPGNFPRVKDEVTEVPQGGVLRSWRWLEAAACRPGSPARERPVLLWDNRPEDVVDGLLKRRAGVESRPDPDSHGVGALAAAESWAWLATTLLGVVPSEGDVSSVRAGVDAEYPGPGTPAAEAVTRPAPGEIETGRGPAAQRTPTPLAAARAVLGVERRPTVRRAFAPLVAPVPERGLVRPDWIRFAPRSPTGLLDLEGEVTFASPRLGAIGRGSVKNVSIGLAGDAVADRRASRWGAERGIPALAYMVVELLEEREAVAGDPGWIGAGPGAVAVAWAAALSGGSGPVVLVDAPVTLWARGPSEADVSSGAPWLPWPTWTLAPVPSGMALDPWQAGRVLADRVRWVRPRSGTGAPWKGPLPGGSRYESVAEATQW